MLRDLEAVGYRPSFDVVPLATGGNELRITLLPLRVVRRIYLSGHWPLLSLQVLSYISWRTGYRLPEGEALVAEIYKQEQELTNFLHRSGYYDATAHLVLDWEPEAPELVDVRVRINLNAGFFRLRYNIGEIRAEGFYHMGSSKLRGIFQHCCLWLGRTGTERINEDFKRLIEEYQSKDYVGVRLTKREIHPDHARKLVDLDLAIEERKRVSLRFSGRKSISEKELRKPEIMTIFRDNYASANELDESARNIFRLYQSRGFFDARVSWRWLDRSSDPMRVEFIIHEGPQLKVREIEFLPAAGSPPLTLPQSKLAEQITTRRYPRLGLIGLGQGGFVSAVQLEQDVRRLEDFYHREGYPRARVDVEMARSKAALNSLPLLGVEAAVDSTPDDADLFVRFRITEGHPEVVADVEVSFLGPHSQSEEQVKKVLGLKAGTPYTIEAGKADQQRLAELFQSAGHPYAEIDSTSSTWNADHTRVHIRWVIDEREPVTFGPIIIRGNFVTRQSVIRGDLPFKEGDPYSRNKLLEGQQNLIARQIFTSVRVLDNPGETDEFRLEARAKHWTLRRNPVPVLVEVVERYDSMGQAEIGVGFSTDNPVFGTASYVWSNLAGTGAELEVRGELGVRVQSLLGRIAQPRLGSPFLRLDLRGFWREDNTVSIGLVNSYGANAELTRFVAPTTDEQGHRLPPTLRFFTRLEFNISQVPIRLLRPEGTTNRPEDGDQTQSLKLSFGVVWDRREGLDAPLMRKLNRPVPLNPFMPVAGHLLSAQVTGALCCAFPSKLQGSFIALAAQAVLLRPFGSELRAEDGWAYGMRRFNFKLNLRINYGIPLFLSGLPIVELYYAGGDTSVRGYDLDTLKAQAVDAPVGALAGDVGKRVVPQGGSLRILSQLEWEFAITPKLLSWPWVGALFVDMGAVSDGWEKLRWNDIRFSIGVSLLRVLTQFGALSLDYAYPLTLPGQDPLLQSERWKHESWYQHFPGRIHFNWGMPISL